MHEEKILIDVYSQSIQEVAREAEEKERVAKEAKKARQEQEAMESSAKVTSPVLTAAESTAHEAVNVSGIPSVKLLLINL